MTPQEELDYIKEIIDQEINNWEFSMISLEEEKANLSLEQRNPICFIITFVEGNINSLKELKEIIEEKSYREFLQLNIHDENN